MSSVAVGWQCVGLPFRLARDPAARACNANDCTVLKHAEKVTFAIYVMTHGLRVSFFIVELTLVITCVSLLEVQCWSCIPLGQSICGQ